MEISFEIKKRQVYTIIGLVLLFSFLIFVSAQAYDYVYSHVPTDFWGHEGDEIFVRINGIEKPLQQAIDNGDFNGRDLSYFEPTDINQYSFSATTPQTVSIVNDANVKSCLLLKFAEKDANSATQNIIEGPNTCSISQLGNEWKIDIENADCNVVCLKWDPNKYEP